MSGLRHLGPGCAGPALMGLILLAFAALGAAPAQAQTVTTLVSNTGLGVLSAGVANIQAQSFTTGANGDGYEISEIQILIFSAPSNPPDNSVKLRADDGGKPGGLVADLMDPANFVGANGSNTFTVREGTILDPETTYWVVVNEGAEVGSTLSYTATTFDSQTGEAGWSIGNGYLWKSHPSQDWSTSEVALLIAVRGLPGTPPGATDATLSEIVVNKKEGNDRGDEIALEPAFSSDRTSYSFVVGRNSSSFLTVRTTHPRATVRIFEGRLSHLETPPHLEGVLNRYGELVADSLGGGRWSTDFNPSEGRYWIDVTVTSFDGEHQVNYRLDYLARGRPPSLLWALIAPHGSRGTLDRVTLKYDKILRPDGPDPDNPLAPPASAFSVEVEGEPVPVTRTQINAEFLQLRLARELSPQEQQVTVSYTRPATNPVQTNIGGLAFDFTDYPVDVSRAPTTNNSELSVADAEVTEGDGTMDFVVTLAPEQRPPAWVDYATADGTARAGEDYRATSGRVKFRKMETTKTVSVPIIDDAVREDGETFTLVLSDHEGALIADGEATGTILDDGDEGVQPPRPPQNTGTELFSETMTVGYDFNNSWAGYDDGSGGDPQIGMLTGTGFSFGGTPYTVEQVTNSDSGELKLELNGTLTQEDAAPLDLYIGNTPFGLAEADSYIGNRNYRAWDDSGLVLRSGSTILVRIVDRRPAMTGTFENVPRNHNSPFTFEVHFSEEVVVSAETLRDHAFAVTNGEVTGARQLNPPSTMAWEITVASFSEEAVTLVLPETTDCAAAGAICTEDGRMLSADISAVVEGPGATPEPLTATFGDVPSEHTGEAFTFELAFSEEVEISYETLRDDAFEVTGGSVTTASRTAPPSNQEWEITVEPDSDDAVTITLPKTTDCGATGAICTGGDDPRPLSNSPSATVAGPAANTPATGAPTISGTARVDETLTASVSGIADADGLAGASFAYQWIRGSTGIQGATGASYTLAGADEGGRIKVRVSFTDDAGHAESLTSAATGTVEAAPDPPEPLTATFGDVPSEHTGQAFTFGLGFSEELAGDFSHETLRDNAFEVTGGGVTTASRTAPPSNREWEITVEPDSDDAVTITLPKTTDCGATGAICTGGDEARPLSNSPSATVAGPAANTPATGAPTISGTARVGETLTASVSGIADADGLAGASFAYQWIRGSTGIQGAAGASYTLAGADEGARIKVRVSFTDDAGHAESLTSAATGTVEAAPDPPEPLTATFGGVPSEHTGEAFTFGLGFSEEVEISYETLRDDAFEVTGGGVTTASRTAPPSNREWEITVEPDSDDAVTITLPKTTDCGATGAICTGGDDPKRLSNSPSATVAGAGAANTPATGAPTISGTARVGETLTASVSGIADADGLGGASFAYQWIRGSTGIQGAAGASYTLAGADEGGRIKVRVSFTDDAGHAESLTSAATGTVEAAPDPPEPLTATFGGVPSEHTGEAFTFGLGFSEEVEISYETLRDDAFEVTGGGVTTASRTAPPSNREWEITVEPDSDDAVTITLPKTTDCGATGAICTGGDDPKRLSNSPSATVAGAGAANTPATGAPTISGTARVGETLTASVSGIADADGLAGASFAYQWIRGSTGIQGAAGASYTLAGADEGARIKVRVSFTDDAGHAESLTSAATGTVEAAPDPPEPLTATFGGVPSEHTGEAFTFGLGFSEEVEISYETLRDDAFEVTGGGVTTASRTAPPSNREWEITVEPDSDDAVTITLPKTTDCGATGAICTGGDDPKRLSNSPSATVAGAGAANTPATGAPTISGTARVGETLTASVSGIADADGLGGASFAYQWIRGSTGIQGATGSSHALAGADEGARIKVRVSFTDDAGHAESLTSAATGTVEGVAAVPDPLTATFGDDMPASHTGEQFTFGLAFSEELADDFSYKTLRDDAFSVTGGSVKKASRQTQGSNLAWNITVEPASSSDTVAIALPKTTDCGATGAICTEDGRKLSHPLSATVVDAASAGDAANGDNGDAADDALALAAGVTPDEAAAMLLGEGDLSEAQLGALDQLGNGNGRYDLGDLLSWIARCRRGEARCGGTSTDAGPASSAALLAAAAAGHRGMSRRRRRHDSGRRGRRPVRAKRRRARRAGYALAMLLAAMTWSCADDSVGPAAIAEDPGFLTVEWTAPAANRDIGVLLELEGPGIETVRAPGLELYQSGAPGRLRIIVAGSLRAGPLVQFQVPDRGQLPLYRARVLQVTGEDYGLRDKGEYRAVITH